MATAIGGMGLMGCCKHLCSKSGTAPDSEIDFSRIAYCCINCDACPLYKATIIDDKEAKKKIAEQWGDAKKPDFELGDFYCYGCKDERSKGTPGRGCTVRKCTLKKGYATCAQCTGFEDCDEKLWQNFPGLRDDVRAMKARLGIT
jgi:predicted metal-binding transcription factor (methanogenesis marker protein 9)